MAATAETPDPASNQGADPGAAPPRRRSKLPLLLGLPLAILGGAGGYMAVGTGLIGGHAAEAAAEDAHGESPLEALAPAAFVALPPLTVNVGGTDRFLRFAGQVEVDPAHLGEVEALTPRIVDVLNGYLRAVEPGDLESASALIAIRSQLLRRVQVVAGGDRVRDLLVMEFVVN